MLVALKYFATGCSISSLKDVCRFDLSVGAVVNCIRNVSRGLGELKDSFIKFCAETKTIVSTKEGFINYGGFPACVGAIDGTHIQIKPPPLNEEAYVCRKGFHSINVQVVCNHNQLLTDVLVKWPGSTHDTAIWNNSSIKQLLLEHLKAAEWNGWLIGDSGYPQRPYMMVPLADPQSKEEIAYNNSLTKCRNTVERTLGVLKSRFRVLERKSGGGIQYELETAVNIIMACCVLHNYCRLRNMDYVADEGT